MNDSNEPLNNHYTSVPTVVPSGKVRHALNMSPLKLPVTEYLSKILMKHTYRMVTCLKLIILNI